MGTFNLGTISLVDRAERIPDLRRYQIGQDRRSAAEVLADLAAQVDRQLQRSPSWRAGQPLQDHRIECDCPRSLAGCVERQGWPTSTELGGRGVVATAKGRYGSVAVHGRYSTYVSGCHCDACRRAAADYQRRRRHRRSGSAR